MESLQNVQGLSEFTLGMSRAFEVDFQSHIHSQSGTYYTHI